MTKSTNSENFHDSTTDAKFKLLYYFQDSQEGHDIKAA